VSVIRRYPTNGERHFQPFDTIFSFGMVHAASSANTSLRRNLTMITLTDNAVAAMKTALSRASEPAEGFRIMVQARGCGCFKYEMVESVSRQDDAIIEKGGVRVFVDAGSQAHVSGMTVDFVTGVEPTGFVFDNPNAPKKCACGKSCGCRTREGEGGLGL
jgi:iron-sulfur cluster assembly protein